jgi:hypothetical protein
MTMEIYSRALRCIVRPGKTKFKVTPKQGIDGGGMQAVRRLHLVVLCAVLLGGGTLLRLLDLAGVGPLHDLPGVAAVIVPILGLIELRRVMRTLLSVSRRHQRRLVYRFQGDAAAHCFTAGGQVEGRVIDASASGVGLVLEKPVEVGTRPAMLLELPDATGQVHEVSAQVEVRSCREVEGRHLIGATIHDIEPAARMRLMEWCYVVCNHEQLRGHRPDQAAPAPELEPIVGALDTAERQPVLAGEAATA